MDNSLYVEEFSRPHTEEKESHEPLKSSTHEIAGLPSSYKKFQEFMGVVHAQSRFPERLTPYFEDLEKAIHVKDFEKALYFLDELEEMIDLEIKT